MPKNLMRLRSLLIRLIKPISIWVGKIYYAPKQRVIKSSDILAMASNLRSGDVLLTFSFGEFTNYFIEGDFKHAAIYIGREKVVEATGRGVVVSKFEDFCSGKDRVAVLRPIFCDESSCGLAAMNAISQIGKPYDYYFEPGDESFYCAELITWAYFHATIGASSFIKREIMGVETVLPTDFYNAKSKFQVVIERPKR